MYLLNNCFYLTILTAPPRIDRMPGDLFLPEGDNTKIKIYYAGDQPMEVSLSKDGNKIDETTHIKYTVFDEYMIIFIKEIKKSDAGIYSLTVKNDSGCASASFTVYITGKQILTYKTEDESKISEI